MACPVT